MTSGTAPWAAAPCALSEWSFYHWVGSFSGPWPVAAACFQRIRATLLPALLSFCAAVSVKQYDAYDMSQPCCHSSCSTPHSLAVQALSSKLETRVQQEAEQLTKVLMVSLLFSCFAA